MFSQNIPLYFNLFILIYTFILIIPETGDDTPLSPPEVCQVLNIATKQLQNIDTASLQRKEDYQTFFINLFNLVFLHAIMLIASGCFHQCREISISKLYNILKTPLGRNAFFHLICYNVGQMGRISAFDIYNHLLMDGKVNEFLGLSRKRKGKWESFQRNYKSVIASSLRLKPSFSF